MMLTVQASGIVGAGDDGTVPAQRKRDSAQPHAQRKRDSAQPQWSIRELPERG